MSKEERGVGQPTVMTEATLQLLHIAFSMGATDEQACLFAKISPSTLYNYQVANPEYLEEKKLLKENPTLRARFTVYKDLDNPNTARWYLEKKAKTEFGNAVDITVKQELNAEDKNLLREVLDKLNDTESTTDESISQTILQDRAE